MLYVINRNKINSYRDINNNDNLNQNNQNNFLVHNDTFIGNEKNIKMNNFVSNEQVNIRKNKINNNGNNLKQNETTYKNTFLSCLNNLEKNNLMSTNIDDGLKDLIVNKEKDKINIKNTNNKINCMIV